MSTRINIDQLKQIAHLHTGRELAKMFNVHPNYMYCTLRKHNLLTKQSPVIVRNGDYTEIRKPNFDWAYPDLSEYFGKRKAGAYSKGQLNTRR